MFYLFKHSASIEWCWGRTKAIVKGLVARVRNMALTLKQFFTCLSRLMGVVPST
ncbi:hypothetical protein Sjap_017180 [Stephania japonica]|uniref:Transposase n=1 Tax=Stephania japonica TaxID=461633 RepID=A0AAP0NK25_9MAGN